MITTLFMDAVNGKYHNENRVITRDLFNELRDTDPYVKYIWSFGNAGSAYLWGKDIEEIKCQACRMLLYAEKEARRHEYIRFIKMIKESNKFASNRLELEPLERLQALSQLEALQRLETLKLHNLEVSNIDYRDYEYKDGDIVYCDVPYEKIGKGKCDDYGLSFDSLEFYKWVKAQKYPVYFSSYEISDDSFYKLKIKSVASLMGATTNGEQVNEYLYSNRPFEMAGAEEW